MLRKRVCDRHPGSHGVDKDVGLWFVARIVVKASHGNHSARAGFLPIGQRRAADVAERVPETFSVRGLEGPQVMLTLGVSERSQRNEQVRGEAGSGCLATSRAVAVVRPNRPLCQLVAYCSTKATTRNNHVAHLAAYRIAFYPQTLEGIKLLKQCQHHPV
jgi:hypothetical protein